MSKFILCLILLFCPLYSFADTDPNIDTDSPGHDEADTSGHKAIDWNFLYIGDGLYGYSGPFANQKTMMDNLLFNLTLDSEKLFKIKGNTIFITWIGIWGSSPNQIIGSTQGIDNIESNYRTSKLYQAWTDQKFFNNKLSVLVGLYDFNSEFAVTNSALIFIMPPMGTPSEIAQTGVNGPSVYPTTSLATRFKITPNDNWYFQFAAFDGIPGNPNHQYGTHVDLVKSNGLFWAFENGVNFGPDKKKYHLAVGAWFYTSTTDALLGDPPEKFRNNGLYGMIDIPVYRPSKESDRGINLFLRPGIANNRINIFSPVLGGGLYWKGPFAKRPDDETGFAFSYADSTDSYVIANSPTALTSETLLEYTYLIHFNEHLVIQPTLEWVLPTNQSSEEPSEHSSVLGLLRLKATT